MTWSWRPWSLGTAALGGLYEHVDEGDARDLVAAALARGMDYFDTAPQYGHGTAELRLGHALADIDRSSYRLATKVGRRLVPGAGEDTIFADVPDAHPVFDFSADGVRRSLEDSLRRLDVDHIDVVLIHDPDDHAQQAIDEAYPVLHEWRAAGVVGAIGVGMNQSAVPSRFIRETDIDIVLLAGRYTLLDHSGASDLLPLAVEHHVSIQIGGVFNSGCLATAAPPSDGTVVMYDYQPASPAIIDRITALRSICAQHGVTLPQAALAFPLRHPAVVSVLLGARNVDELAENLTNADVAIPDDLWSELSEEGLIDDLDR